MYSAVDNTITKRSNIQFKSISTEALSGEYNVAVGQDGNLYAMKANSDESPVQLTTSGNYIYATGALYSPTEGASVSSSARYVVACTSTGVYRIGTYTYTPSNNSYTQSLTPVALKTGIDVLQLTGDIYTEAAAIWHALVLYLEQGTAGPGKLARVGYNRVVDLGFRNTPNWTQAIG